MRGLRRVEQEVLSYTAGFLLVVLGLAAATAQEPETVAWRNGAWFDGTGFRRVDVYSIGDRLTLKTPAKVDHTVDLTGSFAVGAFGEATSAAIFPKRAPFGLAEGALASFIAFESDPLQDLEPITRVSLGVKAGRELHQAR